MIHFSRFKLDNGLTVIIHEDQSTPMAAINVLYNVGARDESPDKTGFAHLFEHLMFGGSEQVPDFDQPIQHAGGDSNAFTNSDITNFYDIVPAENLEVALWLESDRMMNLGINARTLEVQRKVVMEEFKETCLNQPYGDVWHLIGELAYQVHPYRWPTIGKELNHIANATLDDVQAFYDKFYSPNNAILVVAGNVKTKSVKEKIEKWFSDIPPGNTFLRDLPREPRQSQRQMRVNTANVPVDGLYMAFHIPERIHNDYYIADLLSDVLSNGPSSRLYRRLYKENRLFASIDAYVTGSIDPGLLIIEGKTAEGVSIEKAEAAVWKELENLKNSLIPDIELQKLKNKVESTLVFSESSILNKAINLAFFDLLGNTDLINQETQLYQNIQLEDLQRVAREVLTPENCSELYYMAN